MAQIQLPGVGYVDGGLAGRWMLPGAGYVVVSGGGDTTAPTLTSPTGTQTGQTTATVGATTDEGNGTLYAIVSTSATPPSVAQIQAGQNSAGAAASWAGNVVVTSTGAKTLNATGLAAGTTYYAHLQHRDAANNDSTVATSSSFTTSDASSSVSSDLTASYSINGYAQRDLAASYSVINGAAVSLNTAAFAIKNNLGVAYASESFKLSFYRADTDAFVVNKNVTTDASGLLGVVSDELLMPGVSYEIKIKHISTGGLGIFSATAA